jgi:hypothetical protein
VREEDPGSAGWGEGDVRNGSSRFGGDLLVTADGTAHSLTHAPILEQVFETSKSATAHWMSCLKTSVTNLYQDIGDASGALGGDTSPARRARHVLPDLPMSGQRAGDAPILIRVKEGAVG